MHFASGQRAKGSISEMGFYQNRKNTSSAFSTLWTDEVDFYALVSLLPTTTTCGRYQILESTQRSLRIPQKLQSDMDSQIYSS